MQHHVYRPPPPTGKHVLIREKWPLKGACTLPFSTLTYNSEQLDANVCTLRTGDECPHDQDRAGGPRDDNQTVYVVLIFVKCVACALPPGGSPIHWSPLRVQLSLAPGRPPRLYLAATSLANLGGPSTLSSRFASCLESWCGLEVAATGPLPLPRWEGATDCSLSVQACGTLRSATPSRSPPSSSASTPRGLLRRARSLGPGCPANWGERLPRSLLSPLRCRRWASAFPPRP